MEGYFVRTLGMHRVYNSAFMNMMRDEKNAEYRLVVKNTLEFDPQILKRYVNFMNNPDERTAVDQFGKGDKYFGVATVLATMPGLPMFGHGQVEGYAERYGMEYRRAYLDETPDAELVARHEREIFPLIHQRWLFAEVENFALYDFFTADGAVNEDVFAFSNSRDGKRVAHRLSQQIHRDVGLDHGPRRSPVRRLPRALACAVARTIGWSCAIYVPGSSTFARSVTWPSAASSYSCTLMKRRSTRRSAACTTRTAGTGASRKWLGGRAVPSIDDAMLELELQPLHDALRATDEQEALDFVAERLGGPPPAIVRGENVDEKQIAASIEALVAARQPDMARGKWIYEWAGRPRLAQCGPDCATARPRGAPQERSRQRDKAVGLARG